MVKDEVRKWLKQEIVLVEDLSRLEFDEAIFDSCRQTAQKAAVFAADCGLADAYDRCRGLQSYKPIEVRALLGLMLSELESLIATQASYLDCVQAANYLGVTRKSLYGLVERGRLKPLRGPRNKLLFTRELLDAYVRENSKESQN
jgi:excisionase family DNA binding protein